MQPASTALTLAASPSALTLTALRDALAAEAAYQAAIAATAPTRKAANGARDVAREHKRRKSLAAAAAAAEALANATAEALGYEAKADAATAASGELSRCLYADRLRALALGALWTGAGYADVLADAIADPRRDGGYHGGFKPLGELPAGATIDALTNYDAYQAELTSVICRAHLPSTDRHGAPCVDVFEAVRIRFPEVCRWTKDGGRRAVNVGLTGTNITREDLRAYGAVVDMAEALAELAERYAAAYPLRSPRDDAADLIASGGAWRLPTDAPDVVRGPDPRA